MYFLFPQYEVARDLEASFGVWHQILRSLNTWSAHPDGVGEAHLRTPRRHGPLAFTCCRQEIPRQSSASDASAQRGSDSLIALIHDCSFHRIASCRLGMDQLGKLRYFNVYQCLRCRPVHAAPPEADPSPQHGLGRDIHRYKLVIVSLYSIHHIVGIDGGLSSATHRYLSRSSGSLPPWIDYALVSQYEVPRLHDVFNLY